MIWDAITAIIPWQAIAAIVGAVVAMAAAWISGRRSGAVRAKNKGLEGYRKTRKEMDNVEIHDDPDTLRDWLRERGERPGDL